MIDEYGVQTRRRWTRRSVFFLMTGVVMLLVDIATISLFFLLPDGLGTILWPGIIAFAVILITSSPSVEKIAPSPPSKASAEQVDRWEKSGDVATMVSDVSWDETQRIEYFTRRHFGKYVYATVTTRKGKTRTFTMFRVGSKILPGGHSENGQPSFNLILYRIDLASQKGIRRPWRTFFRQAGNFQQTKPHPLIEIPNWIA